MKAYALLRTPQKDIPLTTKEAYLGRDPTDLETELAKSMAVPDDGVLKPNKSNQQQSKVHIKISDSRRVSKTACKVFLDAETDLFSLQNLSKNTILVDRMPLHKQDIRPLFHKSLIQIGDTLLFFLLPNETQEKKKRFLKQQRKQLLD